MWVNDKPADDGYNYMYPYILYDANNIINESNYLFISKDYKDCFFKFIFLQNIEAEMFQKQDNLHNQSLF